MTNEPTIYRPCCGDAHERHGAAAPLFGEGFDQLVEPVVALPEVPAALVRPPANIARHECGHALVALALGGEIGSVTVVGQPSTSWRLPRVALWPLLVAVYLGGDAATVGEVADPELLWHVTAVRNCGGGSCDRCNAVRRIVVGLRHPPDEDVVAEYRRIEATLAEFFARPDVRSLVSDIAWDLFDEGTITGEYIEQHFGPRVRELKLEI